MKIIEKAVVSAAFRSFSSKTEGFSTVFHDFINFALKHMVLCKSSFHFFTLLGVFEGRCHFVLAFTMNLSNQQRERDQR